jgi:hypothetical protein
VPLIDADAWYETLMNAHHGLSDGQSIRLNCALVLLLADRVADLDELGRCLTEARAAALHDTRGTA